MNELETLRAENTRLRAELDAIIQVILDATDIADDNALGSVNDLLHYHFHMVNAFQEDCNRLKAQLAKPETCACGNHPAAPGNRVCEECADARKLYPMLFGHDLPDETA